MSIDNTKKIDKMGGTAKREGAKLQIRVSERIHYALELMRKACKKDKVLSIFAIVFLLY